MGGDAGARPETVGEQVGLLWSALESDSAPPPDTSERTLRRVLTVRAALGRS